MYYNATPKNINNSKLKYYLLSRHLYPGSNGYRVIEAFFRSHRSLHRSIFTLLNNNFAPFLRQLSEFFCYLRDLQIEAKMILKYRNMLTDFHSWLVLNDIKDPGSVDAGLCLDYLYSRHYTSLYSPADLQVFVDALKLYFKTCHFRNIPLDSLTSHVKIHQFNYDFSEYHLHNVLGHIQNKQLKLLLIFIIHMGLPMQALLPTKIKDLDLFNQCLVYKGVHSGQTLYYPFDRKFKTKISELFEMSGENILFDSYRPGLDSAEALFREFAFALLNARLPAKLANSILENLHYGVFQGIFPRN